MAKDLDKIAKTIVKDQSSMAQVREPRESNTQRINDMFRPTRSDLDYSKQEGDKKAPKVYFPQAELGLFKWGQAYASSTVSQRGNWFDSEFSVEEINNLDVAQIYLQATESQMRNAFQRSNFYDEVVPMIMDAGADGNGFMEPIHDIDLNEARFETQDPSDVWISRDKYKVINRVHLRARLTAEAAYALFKDSEYQGQKLVDNLPEELRRNATEETGNPLAEYNFIHARWKNPDRRMESILSEDKEFLNAWVCETNGEIVELNGVDWMTLPWTPNRTSRNVYGTGLAAHALNAALMGNAYAKKRLQKYSIAAEGRFKASKGVRGKFDRRPGGTTYLNDGETIEMLTEKTSAPETTQMHEEFADVINEWFMLKLFLAVSSIDNPKDVTAFYVSQLQGEKAQVLTSSTTTFESFLNMVYEFVWSVEEGAGRMPPMPAELQAAIDQYEADNPNSQVSVKPNFIGPLFAIQREFLKLGPLQKGLEGMERLDVLFPESKVKVDGDKLYEEYLDATGFPEKIQRTDAEVEEIRAAEAAALAQQQQQEMLKTGIENTSGLDKAPEDGSILAEQLAQ